MNLSMVRRFVFQPSRKHGSWNLDENKNFSLPRKSQKRISAFTKKLTKTPGLVERKPKPVVFVTLLTFFDHVPSAPAARLAQRVRHVVRPHASARCVLRLWSKKSYRETPLTP